MRYSDIRTEAKKKNAQCSCCSSGGLNLGVITPVLPGNSSFIPGGGNSVNYGREQPLIGGYGGAGTGSTGSIPSSGGPNPSNKDEDDECDGPCHGLQPPSEKLCGNSRMNNCFGLMRDDGETVDCRRCLDSWEEEWCEGNPNYGKYTGLGGNSGGGGTAGPIGARPIGVGGRTGDWGPIAPKPCAPGNWAIIQGMIGGGNGRGGLYDPGAMQLLRANYPGELPGDRPNDPFDPYTPTYPVPMPGKPGGGGSGTPHSHAYSICCACASCSQNDCDALERALKSAKELMDLMNRLIFALGVATAILMLIMVLGTAGSGMVIISEGYYLWYSIGIVAAQAALYAWAINRTSKMVERSVSKACYKCIRKKMGDLANTGDEWLLFSVGQGLGLISLYGRFTPRVATGWSIGSEGIGLGLDTNPWNDWYPTPGPMAPSPDILY